MSTLGSKNHVTIESHVCLATKRRQQLAMKANNLYNNMSLLRGNLQPDVQLKNDAPKTIKTYSQPFSGAATRVCFMN